MVTNRIKFNYNRTFLGRNGGFHQSGLEITNIDTATYPSILLEPITSKNKTGRCFMEIPKENIQELIDILEKIK